MRPIGVMHMRDQGKADDKVLAVHAFDPRDGPHPRTHHGRAAAHPPRNPPLLPRLQGARGEEVVIDPFEGREKALQVIQKSLEDYLALPRSFFVH